jgi:aspartyl-tRNA(Asn)/glutamyl-tRNA(Gln) amidotransferase subunit C
MARVTVETVEHVARLAQLSLTAEEKESFARELQEILAYAETIQGLDTEAVEPMSHAAAAEVLREEGCVTPTVAWANPPDDLAFRPLVNPSPVLPWTLMLSPVNQYRADIETFREAARSIHDAVASRPVLPE